MLNHPTGLFSGDYNSALRGCCPLKFLHTLQLPKMYFKSYLGRRAASCWTLPYISSFLFFNQTQDLRAPSADRHETLPRDHYLLKIDNPGPKIQGALPWKIWGAKKTCKIWTDFTQLPNSLRISPERDKISKIGKTHDLERFLPRSVKQDWWTSVHYPQSSTCEFRPTQIDFFDRLYFDP